ncbi:MAG: DNA-processing protein DprA [Lachnospiraceae bacterium]|nr:DNA-processing protein DprA [Lachnospiraceae bacterium]
MDIDEFLSFNIPECERPYAFWLVSVPWIGQGPVPSLLELYGSPKEIFEKSDEELLSLRGKAGRKLNVEPLLKCRKNADIFRMYDDLDRSGMKISFAWDDDYPVRLKHIPDPPTALFYLGKLPRDEKLSVAVIGSRQCSEYGEKLACELGEALGENDINVISGMAVGIDGISQAAALGSGGESYAVLGSGADVCYPDSNYSLYEKLKNLGGVISAYPPGTSARAQFFPPRNRIVSGLADAVVVLEARSRSGTLITVDMALEQGRDIYAAPGRLGDELSAGCNGLIGHGALVYLSPEIFIRDLFEDHADANGHAILCGSGIAGIKKNVLSPSDERHRNYSGEEMKCPLPDEQFRDVYEELTLFPRSAEEIDASITRKQKTSPGETGITLMLMELCIGGFALQVSPGQYIRRL